MDALQPPETLVVTRRGWVYRDHYGRRWLVRDVRERERPIVYRVPDTDREATHRVFRSHDGFRTWMRLADVRRFLGRLSLLHEADRAYATLRQAIDRYGPPGVGRAIDARDRETGRFFIGPALDDPQRAQTRAAAELRKMARERRTWDTT